MSPSAPADSFPDLYLPTGPQTLLAALASALAAGHPAEILYLEDAAPLPAPVEANLRQDFPGIVLKRSRDSVAIEEFASLPRWCPAILRRNLSFLPHGRPVRPKDCPGAWMGTGYRNAYVYLTGNFIAKTLRSRCQTIILREEGLGNYHGLAHGWGKAMLRRLAGLPRYQVMGEEPWVDRIEIARPQNLPPALGAKATALSLIDLMEALPEKTARQLAGAFWTGASPKAVAPRALLLTQPIAKAGFASIEEARALYAAITAELRASGLHVLVKPHPQEAEIAGPDVLPAFFPIEAWPWLGVAPFDLVVALCSAALEDDGVGFSRTKVQLIRPQDFRRGNFQGWQERLRAGLRAQSRQAIS